MYESHFGLSGPPFQLNPDPSFYFDSRGHNNALAYLNFGVHQGEGFIVVTGEVGAGKTTLVRKLLAGLDSAEVISAQIVSTQLEAGDLLRTVLRAFGESSQDRSKAEVIGALEAYLTTLSVVGRRALLVVDEAQNLPPEAIEELRMLSNFQWGQRPVLQSFLVGQPELRGKLQLPWMEQLRQRVIASCHLGPLDPPETRAYVEHRLRRVGWQEWPQIASEAYDQIHVWSQGIPRRINLLCNRLLLAAYLANEERINADDVARIAADFRGEMGEVPPMPGMGTGTVTDGASPSSASQAVGAAAFGATVVAPGSPQAAPEALPAGRALVELRRSQGHGFSLVAPIFCVVDTAATRLRCAALAKALETQRDMPPLVVVNPGLAADWPIDESVAASLPEPAVVAHLEVAAGAFATATAAVQMRFAELVRQWGPGSVLVLGRSDATLACALVAAKLGRAVFRIASPCNFAPKDRASELNVALLDTLTDMLLVEGPATAAAARAATQAHHVASLMARAVALLMPLAPAPHELLQRRGVEPPPDHRFVLVSCQAPLDLAAPGELAGLVNTLCELSARTLVVWPAERATRETLAASGFDLRLRETGVVVADPFTTLESFSLLKAAACLLFGRGLLLAEEGEALGTPLVALDSAAVLGGDTLHAVLSAAGLAGPSAPPAAHTPPHLPVDAGIDIVALLRRWRLRERLASAGPAAGVGTAGAAGPAHVSAHPPAASTDAARGSGTATPVVAAGDAPHGAASPAPGGTLPPA